MVPSNITTATFKKRSAGLLASASQESDSLSPSFVETLKQLTPKEAKYLDHVFAEVKRRQGKGPRNLSDTPTSSLPQAPKAPPGALETYERLGLIRRDYDVTVGGSHTFNSSNPERVLSQIESALDSS